MGAKYALIIFALVVAGLVSAGRCPGADSSSLTTEWKVGYWLWQGWMPSKLRVSENTVDLLYVQVGNFWSSPRYPGRRLSPAGIATGPQAEPFAEDSGPVQLMEKVRWPVRLPKAEAYIALWRNTSPRTPGKELVPTLLAQYQELKRQAAQVGQRLRGLQIDHDCPTNALPEYARFLQELRAALPPEDLLSITALLDWFRPGTGIAEVLQSVNEYVPQFYDVESTWIGVAPTLIAKAIDSAKWAPIFNSYDRPYRIGIATFGRIVRIKPQVAHQWEASFFRYLSPLELAGRQDLTRVAERRNDAGETVVRYEARAEMSLNDLALASGTILEMVLPSQQSVQSAYLAAKAFGGLCAGVVFFRWPAGDYEALVLTSDEIQDIISGKKLASRPTELEVEQGQCVVVGCADLYLRLGDRFSSRPVIRWLHSSSDLEYILPAERLRAKIQRPRTVEIHIPPYSGVPRLPLGRVVTRERAQFSLGSKP